jgi:hypothetical protein
MENPQRKIAKSNGRRNLEGSQFLEDYKASAGHLAWFK